MTSALRWGWMVSTTPRPLYPRERPGTDCTGGWVGPRVGLDGCGKSCPPPGFDPRTVQPVASRYTDWAIPDRFWVRVKLNFTYFTDTSNTVEWNKLKGGRLEWACLRINTLPWNTVSVTWPNVLNPLNAKLNPIRHLLGLVGARHIVHVSGIRFNETTPWRWLEE